MMETITSIKTAQIKTEFEGILCLQKQNHGDLITETQKQTDGFVTVKHDEVVLKKMATQAPQYIAIHQEKVIGYVLAMVSSLQVDIPILKPMFDEFKKIPYQSMPLESYKYIVSGQVCIEKNYRGLGLLEQMYQQMKNDLCTSYDLCVTEIAVTNKRSIRAHEKIGFGTLCTYFDGTQDWHIIAWDWTN